MGLDMEKVIRDGCVAVLYSPGYGAGWSTWAEENERELLLFDPHIVQLVLDRDQNRITPEEFDAGLNMVWQLKSYESYRSAHDLTLVWLPVGTLFRVEEYDGSETVVLQHEYNWITA